MGPAEDHLKGGPGFRGGVKRIFYAKVNEETMKTMDQELNRALERFQVR